MFFFFPSLLPFFLFFSAWASFGELSFFFFLYSGVVAFFPFFGDASRLFLFPTRNLNNWPSRPSFSFLLPLWIRRHKPIHCFSPELEATDDFLFNMVSLFSPPPPPPLSCSFSPRSGGFGPLPPFSFSFPLFSEAPPRRKRCERWLLPFFFLPLLMTSWPRNHDDRTFFPPPFFFSFSSSSPWALTDRAFSPASSVRLEIGLPFLSPLFFPLRKETLFVGAVWLFLPSWTGGNEVVCSDPPPPLLPPPARERISFSRLLFFLFRRKRFMALGRISFFFPSFPPDQEGSGLDFFSLVLFITADRFFPLFF